MAQPSPTPQTPGPVEGRAEPENPWAFPVSVPDGFYAAHEGMTLRDWFAGQAIIGIMSTSGAFERADRRAEMVARKAFEFADAMLAQRERQS